MKRTLSFAIAVTLALLSAGAEASVPTKQSFIYKTVGNTAIRADVFRPAADGRRPVIVWIHPGGLIMGSRAMLPADACQRFIDSGFIVVAVDHRLAAETKLPEILQDIDDAFRWVRDKGRGLFDASPEQTIAVGASAGGFLALMAGVRVKPRLRAIVSFYGYGDVAGTWYSRPNPFSVSLPRITREEAYRTIGAEDISEAPVRDRNAFYVYCRQNGLWPNEVVGIDPDAENSKYTVFSPERLVTPDYPPTMLLHGDQDVDVPFEMSERMAAALAQQRVEYSLIRMEGFNHAFDVFAEYPPRGAPIGLARPKVAEAFDRVVAFLVKHTHL